LGGDAVDDETVKLVADGYDAVYDAVPAAPTLWQIWLDHAVGRDFPGEFSHISFASLADLRGLLTALSLRDGDLLADIACGMGGPSLWMASQAGIRVVGIDASGVAVTRATARARGLDLGDRCEFRVGTFEHTGLPDAAVDAWLSLDALQYAPDKSAAIREIARVMKPGGRVAFTAFEVIAEHVAGLPVLGDDPVDDYESLLAGAGLEVNAYEETPGALDRMTAAYEAILDHAEILEREMGATAYGSLALEVALTLQRRPYPRRVLAIATRT
jgi:SAM-dependent methyltransferase